MLSSKQWEVFCFGGTSYDALICEGAVRSGKTSIMSVAYIDWAMERFDRCAFIIAGVSVETAKRNVVNPAMGAKYLTDRYALRWTGKANCLTVSGGGRENLFYVFGGRDEASYRIVQGLTAAGCLLDEVVLMPRSFVEQCMARCSVDGSKFWFSCNPGAPSHWFYREWVQAAREKNAYRIHFLLRDNPGLSEKVIKRYESQYTGVFHDRYIKGLWVQAEGLVYPGYKDALEETYEGDFTQECISLDYGTMNPLAALKWRKDPRGKWHAVAEYYYSGREEGRTKTDREYAQDLIAFAEGMDAVTDEEGNIVKQGKTEVIVDPSAASFIAELRQTGRFKVLPADNDVLDGIRETMTCLDDGTVRISRDCKRTIDEFAGYVWDDKSEEDRPIKESDHCLAGDTTVMTDEGPRAIKDLVGTEGIVWSYDGEKAVLMRYRDCRMTSAGKRLVKVTFGDGRSIRLTSDHMVLTDDGWIEAGNLAAGSKVVDIVIERHAGHAGYAVVERVDEDGYEPVYNLEVEGTHCFAVEGGIIVHNCMDAIRYLVHTKRLWKPKFDYKSPLERHR